MKPASRSTQPKAHRVTARSNCRDFFITTRIISPTDDTDKHGCLFERGRAVLISLMVERFCLDRREKETKYPLRHPCPSVLSVGSGSLRSRGWFALLTKVGFTKGGFTKGGSLRSREP